MELAVEMQRHVEVIGAAWGLGGADPGCADAPDVLAPLLVEQLQRCGVPLAAGPTLRQEAPRRRRQLAVSRLCGELAHAVSEAMRRGRLPCVLGGDHSCAGGNWTGAAREVKGPLGLIWVDAHMDAHTPGTSHTGRLHGMPLAWLLGQDDDPLYGLAAGVLAPQHVALLGVRSFEPEERERLEFLGVRVMYMDEIRRRGVAAALDEALVIATRGTAAFGISVDLDAVSPDEAPGVGTPVPEGMAGRDLVRAMQRIGGRADLAAVELAEYCPRHDPSGRSARIAVDVLGGALCGARYEAHVLA